MKTVAISLKSGVDVTFKMPDEKAQVFKNVLLGISTGDDVEQILLALDDGIERLEYAFTNMEELSLA